MNPSITTVYNVAGTSSAGFINTGIATVNVNALSITISSNTSICKGQTAQLTSSGVTGYLWSTGSPFSSTPVTPLITTVYMVTGTDANLCHLSNTVMVTVKAKPNVLASASNTTICKGEALTLSASGASTYSWSTGSISMTVTFIPPLDLPYNYNVIGTDVNGCSDTTFVTVKVNKCTGIVKATKNETLFSVYPNPNTGNFVIETQVDMELRLVNALGQTIEVFRLNQANSHKVSVSELAKGVYFITGEKKI